MKFDTARRFALSLPGATEQPHHSYGSFRIGGRIFATFPPDKQHLHVFVPGPVRDAAVAVDPDFVETLRWGGKVVGLRLVLAAARADTVKSLLRQAYELEAAAAVAKSAAAPALARSSRRRAARP